MNAGEIYQQVKHAGLRNNFIDSVMRRYERYGNMSDKQMDALIRALERHDEIINAFRELEETGQMAGNNFLTGLYRFYDEKRYLSNKQYATLMKTRAGNYSSGD